MISSSAPSRGSASGNSFRCSICLGQLSGDRCSCGARADEAAHRTLAGVRYLLGQLTRWEQEAALPPGCLRQLRERYEGKRESLKRQLTEAPNHESRITNRGTVRPAPPTPPSFAVPPRTVMLEKAAESKPPPRSRAVEMFAPPPLPRPAVPSPTLRDTLRNLFSEKNLPWLLSIGIGMFCVGLFVFIKQQWTGLTPGLKVAILFGSTFAAAAMGVGLRRTILRLTGMGFIALAALALPIDFVAVNEFRLMPSVPHRVVGVAGSIVCIAAYAALAGLLRSWLWPARQSSSWSTATRPRRSGG